MAFRMGSRCPTGVCAKARAAGAPARKVRRFMFSSGPANDRACVHDNSLSDRVVVLWRMAALAAGIFDAERAGLTVGIGPLLVHRSLPLRRAALVPPASLG